MCWKTIHDQWQQFSEQAKIQRGQLMSAAPTMCRHSAIAVTALALCGALGHAETPRDERRVERATRLAEVETSKDAPGRADAKTRGENIRASQVTGMSVQNPAGKQLGTIQDVVLDAAGGTIRYAAVSYGGVLGLGDKLFAVPWKAFEFRCDTTDGRCFMVLDVEESELKATEGFDQSNWPDFADRTITEKIDSMYLLRRRARIGDRDVKVDIRTDGIDVDVKKD